jgi:hypothetical protein
MLLGDAFDIPGGEAGSAGDLAGYSGGGGMVRCPAGLAHAASCVSLWRLDCSSRLQEVATCKPQCPSFSSAVLISEASWLFFILFFLLQLPDDCDSNMARAIQASLDDARQAQQRAGAAGISGVAQAEHAAAAGAATVGAAAPAGPVEGVLESRAVDPNRPSDADIIAWENEIR